MQSVRVRYVVWAVLAVSLGVDCRQITAAEFFVLSEPEYAILRVDSVALGKAELVSRLPRETKLAGLIDNADGTLLTFDIVSNSMFVVQLPNGHVTAKVKLDRDIDVNPRGFAMNSQGVLYGVFTGMTLMTIDRATGETTVVANLTGASRVEAIAFGPGDRLFAAGSARRDGSSENFYRVDLQTGKLTLIGATGFADTDALTYGGDTYFYGTNSRAEVANELLRISPRDGKGTVLGNMGSPAQMALRCAKRQGRRLPVARNDQVGAHLSLQYSLSNCRNKKRTGIAGDTTTVCTFDPRSNWFRVVTRGERRYLL
jgi:hypothetical protein